MQSHWKGKIFTIWLGQSASLLTSSVLQISIIWYITQETGSAVMLTYATIAGFLPQTLLGPFAGVFIDRFPKKVVIILADGLVAAASLVLGLIALQGALPIGVIYVILVIRSLGTAFHEPATQSLTPLIVPPEAITQYAGYYQAFDSLCMILSPSIAIILYGYFPFHLIAFVDVAGAICAILLLVSVPFHDGSLAKEDRPKLHYMEETKEGFRVIRAYEGMMAVVLLGAIYSVFYAPIGSLYPLMTMSHFAGSTTESGLVEIVFSLGSLTGALLLGYMGSRIAKHKGLFGSIFFYGLGICISGFLPSSQFETFIVISFFVGITTPFFHGIVKALYQLTIPPEYLGRAFSLLHSARRIGFPLGLIFGGQMADAFGINILYRMAGAMVIVLAVVGSRWPSLRNCCKKC